MKKRIGKILVGLIVLVGLCVFGQSATWAQNTLRLATVDNFPPFSFIENGKLTGVAVDVVAEMAKRVGLQVEFKAYPWARLMESVKDGTIDGGFAAFETEERKAFCLYVGIVQYEEYQLFVKKGKEFPFTGIKDLYGKKIGIDRGVFVSKEFEQAVKDGKITLEEVNDMAMLNVTKVSQGRIDAMIGDGGVIPYYAKVSGVAGEIVSLGPVHEKQAAYLILSKNSGFPNKEEWQPKMAAAIKAIWDDGTYQSILNRYHGVAQ
jgi:polar amino acid transport system substrate-binding protein